jgi:putative FmdB family regulatory protein
MYQPGEGFHTKWDSPQAACGDGVRALCTQENKMPIFEYICKGCGKKFEAIVYGSKQAECPGCKGVELEQQLSTFAAHGTDKGSSAAPMMPCGMPQGGCGNGSCGMN